jgi:hypothetical protein
MAVDFDNPTRDELLHFRKKLLEGLRFEPLTDVDFFRPTAKLRALVQESEALMLRLSQVWDKHDDLLASLAQMIPILEQFEPVLKPALLIGFAPPPLEHFKYATPMGAVSPEEWEHGHALYEKRERLRTIAQELSVQYHSFLHPADVIMQARIAISQINAGQFWAFLARVTQQVAKGTSHVFERRLIPENIKELLSDSADAAIEKAELANPIPVLHIFRAIFAWIRRKENREREFYEFEEKTDTMEFLATYFSWWTDGDGMLAVENIVSDCEETVQLSEPLVQSLLEQARDFVNKMAELKTIAKELAPRSEEPQ